MIPADRLEELLEAVYKVMYDGGAVFDRDTVVPAVIEAVLEIVMSTPPRFVLGFDGASEELAAGAILPGALMAIPEPVRFGTNPSPAQVLLDAADDVDELDRLAKTHMKDVTDDEWVRFAHSPLFPIALSRADFSRYLRDRASRAND